MRENPQFEEPRPAYLVESAENVLRILQRLRNAPQVRVTEVSNELGVARSTAHRLLGTLVFVGFLRHDPVKRVYVPGPALLDVALASTGHSRLRQIAMPHLERVSKSMKCTVHLSVLEGSDIRFVDGCESDEPVRVTARVGSRIPAHSTSSGKVLLAELPRQYLNDLYRENPAQVTEHTIQTFDELVADLEEVSTRGYATNDRENEVGLHAVAVPIRVNNGSVIAAICAARPASPAAEASVPATFDILASTAQTIAEQCSAPRL